MSEKAQFDSSKIINFLIALTTLAAIIVVPIFIAPGFWPKEIKNEIIFSNVYLFIVHLAILISSNLFFYAIYRSENKQFEQYKVEEEDWPWKVDNEKWKIQIKKTLGLIIFNQVVSYPIIFLFSYIRDDAFLRSDYETLPSLFEVLWQMAFCYVVDDFCFYLSHRLLHCNFFYSKIHKIHHEHKITVSIAAEYAHPLEFLFGNIIPTNAGVIILRRRVHTLTAGIYIVYKILGTTHAHSGYNFPFYPNSVLSSLFSFFPKAEYHSYHHLKFNGNYGGGLFIWDQIFKTYHPKYLADFEERNKYKKTLKNE